MATIITRIFESRDDATSAVGDLKLEGVSARAIDVVGPSTPESPVDVRAALTKAGVAEPAVEVFAGAVDQGATAVVVRAGFGHGAAARDVLTRFGGRDLGVQDTSIESTDSRTTSEAFGIPLLSKNPTPLSSLLGLPLLARDEVSERPLVSDPAPFSDLLCMPVLSTGPEQRTTSFGFKMLSDNPAPLSSALGLPLLRTGTEKKTKSFGFKMLSDEPAPFSKILGLPVLLRDD